MTYPTPAVYMEQPSSTGQTMVVTTGSKIQLDGMIDYKVTVSTSAATLTSDGIHILTSTKDQVWTLPSVTQGAYKRIIFDGSTLATQYVKCASGQHFNSSACGDVIKATSHALAKDVNAYVEVVGRTTKFWQIAGYGSTNMISISTST